MTAKQNAFEVLRACEDDELFDAGSSDHDICSHIERHMGFAPKTLWTAAGADRPIGERAYDLMLKHIGLEELNWELWGVIWLGDENTKAFILKKFAQMIISVHGTDGPLPRSMRLL